MDSEASLVGRIAGGTLLVLVGTAVSASAGFATRVIAANHLGPANYGTITLGITFINVISILGIAGLTEGLPQRLPRAEERSRLFFGALVVSVSLALLLTGGSFLIIPHLASAIDAPHLRAVLSLFAVAVPLFVFMRIGAAGLRGIEDVTGQVFGEKIAYKGGLFVTVTIGVLYEVGTAQLALGWVVALAVAGSVIAYRLVKTGLFRYPGHGDGGLSSVLTATAVRSLLVFSAPLMLSQGVWILIEHTDNALIGALLGGTGVGIYDAAFTVSRLFLIVIGSVGVLFTPVFSDLHERAAFASMAQLYKLTAKWTGFLSLPAYLTVLVMPDRILRAVFTPAYAGGTDVLVIVSSGLFLHAIVGPNGNAITAIGDSRRVLVGTTGAFILNLGLNIGLIPRYGITGAVAASAVSFVVLNTYWSAVVYRRAGVTPFSIRYVGPFVLSFLVSGSLLYTLQSSLGLAAVAPALVSHVVILLLFGLKPEEVRFAKTTWSDLIESL